jgi:hypothetical protein
VERGTGGLTIDRLSIIGGGDGLVTSSRTPGIVKDLSADGVSERRSATWVRHAHHRWTDPRPHRHGPVGPTAVTGMRVDLTSTGVRTSTAGPSCSTASPSMLRP